jgi:hypothetical protein
MDRPELRPIALFSLLAVLLFGVATAVADALVETDAERLEEIVRVLEDDGARVDRLAAYADAERVAVLVTERGHAERVHDSDLLRDRLHEVLSPLDGERAELLQVTHDVSGDEGRITVRVRDEDEVASLELTLRREGQTFLLVGARRLG